MIKKTLIITCLSLLASILGFIAQIVFFKEFGTSVEMDLYFLELSIPAAIAGVGPIVISSIAIPYFAHCSAANICIEEKSYSIFKYLIFLSVILSFSGGILAYLNINSALLEKNVELVATTRILILFLWTAASLSIASSFLIALLNYHNNFLHAAWPTVLPPILMMLSVMVLEKNLGVIRISAGYFLASLLQFVILFARARVYLIRSSLSNDHLADIRMLSGRIPVMLISLLPFSVVAPVSYYFASSLPEGSISSLGYGQSFAGFLSVATSMGAAIVGFPGLAVAHAKGQVDSELKKFELTLTFVLMVSIFLAGAITSLVSPIVSLVYASKEIANSSANRLTHFIPWYVISAIFISGINLLRSLAYSRNEQRIIAISGATMITVFVILATPLINIFSATGIAIDTTISFCIFFFSIVFYYRFKNTLIMGIEFYKTMSYVILAAIISGGITTSIATTAMAPSPGMFKLILLLIFYAILFYVLASKVFRISEIIYLQKSVIKICKDRMKIK